MLWQIFHTADEPPPKFPAPFIAARNAQITAAVTAQRNHFALSQAPISFPTVQRRVVVPTIYRSRTFSNGAPARFVSSGYYNGLPIQGQQITEYPSVSEAASSSPLSPLVTFVPTALETSQTAPIQNHLVPVDVGDERPPALISKNLQNQRSFDVNVADDDQNPSSMIVPTAGFSSVAQNYVFDTLSSMPTASVQVPASTTPEIRPIDSSLREHTEELAHPPALQVENMGIEPVKPSAPTLSDSSGLYTTAVYKILAKEQDLSGSKPINGLATSNAEQSAAPIFRSNSGSGFDDNGNDSDGTLASNGASNSNVNSGSSDLVRLEHVPSEVAEVGQQDTVSAAVRKGYRAVDGQYSYAAPVPLDAAAAQVPTRSTTSTLLDKFSTKLPMVTAEDAAKNALMSGHQTMNLIQQRAAHLRTLQPPSPDSTAIESQAFPRTAVRGQDAWIHKGWPAAVSRPSIPSIPEASIPAIPETWPQFQSHQALASPSKSSLVAAGAALAAIRASKAAESAVPSTRPATFELSQTHMPRLHEAKSVAMQRVARKHAALAVKARAQSLVRAPRKMSLSGRNVHGAFAERVFDSKMTRTFGEVANTFPDTTESAASIASVGSAVPRARLEQVQAKGAKPLATALVPAGVSPGGFFSASAGELGVMLITVPAGARAGSTLGLYRVAAGDGSTLEWLLQPATGDAVHASGAGSRRTRAARQGGEPVFSGLLQLPEALATAARSIAGSNKESTGPDMPLADGGPVSAGPKGSKMGVAEQGPRARLLSIDDVEKMSQWQSKELQQLQAQQAPADSRTKLRRSHRDGRDTIMRKDVDGVEHEAVTARGSGGKPVVIGEQTVVPQCSKVCPLKQNVLQAVCVLRFEFRFELVRLDVIDSAPAFLGFLGGGVRPNADAGGGAGRSSQA